MIESLAVRLCTIIIIIIRNLYEYANIINIYITKQIFQPFTIHTFVMYVKRNIRADRGQKKRNELKNIPINVYKYSKALCTVYCL